MVSFDPNCHVRPWFRLDGRAWTTTPIPIDDDSCLTATSRYQSASGTAAFDSTDRVVRGALVIPRPIRNHHSEHPAQDSWTQDFRRWAELTGIRTDVRQRRKEPRVLGQYPSEQPAREPTTTSCTRPTSGSSRLRRQSLDTRPSASTRTARQ